MLVDTSNYTQNCLQGNRPDALFDKVMVPKDLGGARVQRGQALKDAREAAGLTQEDAGQLLDRDKQTLSRWERGERKISAEDYERAMALYATRSGDPSIGQAVLRGTRAPLRFASTFDRFEREIIRMGADDFEVDHVRNVLRSPETAKLFHMGEPGKVMTAEDQERELAIQLDVLRLWVKRHMDARKKR